MHVAIIGTGRVGQTLAYTLIHEPYIRELSLSDIIPNVTCALAEELRHACVGTGIPIKINAYEDNRKIRNADIIIISAGMPRSPHMQSRNDLTHANARIIKSIALEIAGQNRNATYVMITNPVDAMATLFTTYSRAKFVISTGTSLDTLRFKSEIAKYLNVPVHNVEGFVAGEHGERAVFLWSTVKVCHLPLPTYLRQKKKRIQKEKIEDSVREISKMIIRDLGGTKFGPASAFRQIVSALALHNNDIISIATLQLHRDIPKAIHTSIPMRMGKKLCHFPDHTFTEQERQGLTAAARSIWETYQEALRAVE